MALGIAVGVAGIIIVLVGDELTRDQIRSSFGWVEAESVRVAPSGGVVSPWTTWMVFVGWHLILAGAALALASPL